MVASGFLHGPLPDLGRYFAVFKVFIEAAAVITLGYIGVTDFRTHKVRNGSVLILLALYVLYALLTRSSEEIAGNVLLGAAAFAVLLWFYAQEALGGGDVKLVPVVCLWVGAHDALLYSLLLLGLLFVHLGVTKVGWVKTETLSARPAIPYAPSVTGALIGVILLGML